MTSSEKILAGIIEDSEASAAKIIEAAERQAEELIKSETDAAETSAKSIIAEAKKKAEIARAAGSSSAVLLKRDAALKCRRELIDKALGMISEAVNSFDDNRYFDILVKLAEKNRLPQKGVLYLNENDLSVRNISVLSSRLAEFNVTVSEKPEKLIGGFILKYGDILVNCGLDALINEKREELTDCLNSKLFE